MLTAASKGAGVRPDRLVAVRLLLRQWPVTLVMTWTFRQPLSFFWTIPGTVLAGQALSHLSFPEVVAFYATSLLILVLGATGLAPGPRLVPMPIVMGMVAGVFLRFGPTSCALHGDPVLAWAMLATFLALSFRRASRRVAPPISAR